MRVLTVALLTASGIAFAAPAFAQDVYVGAGRSGVGIGVDVGPRHYRDRDYYTERRVYVDDDDVRARGRCRTVIIKRDGMTKRITRCR